MAQRAAAGAATWRIISVSALEAACWRLLADDGVVGVDMLARRFRWASRTRTTLATISKRTGAGYMVSSRLALSVLQAYQCPTEQADPSPYVPSKVAVASVDGAYGSGGVISGTIVVPASICPRLAHLT